MRAQEFTDLWRALRAAYPRHPVTDESFAVYAKSLGDLSREHVGEAVQAVLMKSSYFPTIAEIRQEAAHRQVRAPNEAEALRQIDGPRGNRHPLVTEALDAIGGSYTWRMTEEPTILRSQFLKVYRSVVADAMERALTGEPAPARPSLEPPRETREPELLLSPADNAAGARALLARLESPSDDVPRVPESEGGE